MKQFYTDFLLQYFSESTPDSKSKHEMLLSNNDRYAQAWSHFCKKMQAPHIQNAKLPSRIIVNVLEGCNAKMEF